MQEYDKLEYNKKVQGFEKERYKDIKRKVKKYKKR